MQSGLWFLCKFHSLQPLRERSLKSEYGRFPSRSRDFNLLFRSLRVNQCDWFASSGLQFMTSDCFSIISSSLAMVHGDLTTMMPELAFVVKNGSCRCRTVFQRCFGVIPVYSSHVYASFFDLATLERHVSKKNIPLLLL
jgi:hypothetical protein